MSFLDNTGNIILDAVLTDAGRARMARGDGSFSITKFALMDDEIDYSTYDADHPSGSAWADLETLQTPIFEAFTNNSSVGNSKLVTITRENLLYMPILKLNEVYESSTERHSDGVYVVAVDEDTEDSISIVNGAVVNGIMLGESVNGGTYIRVDQGQDTTQIPPGKQLSPDLVETQYLIRVDNRFGSIVSRTSGRPANIAFVDDDNFATYLINLGVDTEFVQRNQDSTTSGKQTISGPRGTFVQFMIQSSLELNTSTYLFNELGSSMTMNAGTGTVTVDYIDTNIRIEGATTGYKLDIPVRFVKQQ